jgi:hypothetical protein
MAIEKKVPRRIFGPKGDWRKLHNEELHNLYSSKRIEMGRTCSTNKVKRNAYRILLGKPKGKRPLGRQRRRWVDNIKIDLDRFGWSGLDRSGSG